MELKARWEYPDVSDLITSPTFAPRSVGADASKSRYAGAEPGGHDGYVIQPVQNDNGFRVEVFDAADVSAGPVATLGANQQGVRAAHPPLGMDAGVRPGWPTPSGCGSPTS